MSGSQQSQQRTAAVAATAAATAPAISDNSSGSTAGNAAELLASTAVLTCINGAQSSTINSIESASGSARSPANGQSSSQLSLVSTAQLTSGNSSNSLLSTPQRSPFVVSSSSHSHAVVLDELQEELADCESGAADTSAAAAANNNSINNHRKPHSLRTTKTRPSSSPCISSVKYCSCNATETSIAKALGSNVEDPKYGNVNKKPKEMLCVRTEGPELSAYRASNVLSSPEKLCKICHLPVKSTIESLSPTQACVITKRPASAFVAEASSSEPPEASQTSPTSSKRSSLLSALRRRSAPILKPMSSICKDDAEQNSLNSQFDALCNSISNHSRGSLDDQRVEITPQWIAQQNTNQISSAIARAPKRYPGQDFVPHAVQMEDDFERLSSVLEKHQRTPYSLSELQRHPSPSSSRVDEALLSDVIMRSARARLSNQDVDIMSTRREKAFADIDNLLNKLYPGQSSVENMAESSTNEHMQTPKAGNSVSLSVSSRTAYEKQRASVTSTTVSGAALLRSGSMFGNRNESTDAAQKQLVDSGSSSVTENNEIARKGKWFRIKATENVTGASDAAQQSPNSHKSTQKDRSRSRSNEKKK